jgi:cytosine/creatinine deaminase
MAGLLIKNARVAGCMLDTTHSGQPAREGATSGEFALVDIRIAASGIIAGIEPSQGHMPLSPAEAGLQPDDTIDLDNGVVFPGFVECHTHLDKGHIWPRRSNPDGTFPGALENVGKDREANWSATDVATRMEFALRAAEHHGVSAIRTHLDSIGPQIGISWPVFEEMRARWKDRITLQATPLFGIHFALDAQHMREVVAAVKKHGSGILGCVSS